MPQGTFSPDDLRYVVCPVCHGGLVLTLVLAVDAVRCTLCDRLYPIVDGIPILLASRAS